LNANTAAPGMACTKLMRGLSYTGKACHHGAVRRCDAVRRLAKAGKEINAESRRIRQKRQN